MNTAERFLDFPLSTQERALARGDRFPNGIRLLLLRLCGHYCERLVNRALGIAPAASRGGVDVRFCDLR